MPSGELLTRWTIRIALVFYVLAVAGEFQSSRGQHRKHLARWAWTLGCGFYLAHVAAAFQFFHGWSHAAAYRDTARQTAEVIGLDWGGGLYFNYTFTMLWFADVVWWWYAPESRRMRSPKATLALHGFFAFMVFNATVVFEAGVLRWLGLAALCLLGMLGLVAAHRRKPSRLGR